MPRKQSKRPLRDGQPRRAQRPFDAEARDLFLQAIRDGCTIKHACRLVPVHEETVHAWLNKGGRREIEGPRNKAHVEFWEAYQAAQTAGIHEALKDLANHSKSDYRATLSVLAYSGDPRFNDGTKRKRAQLALERDGEELRVARARRIVAEKLAEKAGKDDADAQVAFGLAMVLADETCPVEVRQGLARWAVVKGLVLIERADLSGGNG